MTEFDNGEKLRTQTRTAQTMLLLTAMVHVLAGCALPHRSHVDVSTYSNQELIEFDALVDVPLATAYQNILSNAPACWCTPFSGEIIAHPIPTSGGNSQISFVVPGKFLGSRVELATVRLYAHSESQTRLVGSSHVYPGTWRLTELANWANAASGFCSAPLKSAS